MTDEQMRIAVAEALGWEFIPSHDKQSKAYPDYWNDPEGFEHFEDLPFKDYPNDANTRKEMLDKLSDEQIIALAHQIAQGFDTFHEYASALMGIDQPTFCRHWLKVKGLWEEGI